MLCIEGEYTCLNGIRLSRAKESPWSIVLMLGNLIRFSVCMIPADVTISIVCNSRHHVALTGRPSKGFELHLSRGPIFPTCAPPYLRFCRSVHSRSRIAG